MILFELLKQLVPASNLISTLNCIRSAHVESWIKTYRKETQKFKWNDSNGRKLPALGSLLERSLNFVQINDEIIRTAQKSWSTIVLTCFEPLINELNDYLKHKIEKNQQHLNNLMELIKPLGVICEHLNRINETSVRIADFINSKKYFSCHHFRIVLLFTTIFQSSLPQISSYASVNDSSRIVFL